VIKEKNVGIMTQGPEGAENSSMVDAKAMATTTSPREHVNEDVEDLHARQDLDQVSQF